MTAFRKLLQRIYYLSLRSCAACGEYARTRFQPVLWDELASEWELSAAERRDIDRREGEVCRACGCNARVRFLSTIILQHLRKKTGKSFRSMTAFARSKHPLKIAEINSLGALHPLIGDLPGLAYSEYRSDDPEIRSEDLLALSYGTGSFDLILTSDTLEHVPDFDRAMHEIHRALKPGGAHIFTIPFIPNRATRIRSRITTEGVEHLLPPTYHGAPNDQFSDWLVFNEFGGDVLARIERSGFAVNCYVDPSNGLNRVIEAVRPSS